MGLDTTHGCWNGPYEAFMHWRQWLNFYIMQERAASGDLRAKEISNMGATYEALNRSWDEGLYDDQSVPLNVLMNHSDCEGSIPAGVCGPLADALEGLLGQMPERAVYDYDIARPAAERFIKGLRRAVTAGEAVEFH